MYKEKKQTGRNKYKTIKNSKHTVVAIRKCSVKSYTVTICFIITRQQKLYF